jgi:septal ring factor EnvC (AmiA/AmiB activator)
MSNYERKFDYVERLHDLIRKNRKNQLWLAELWGISPQSVSAQMKRETIYADRLAAVSIALAIPIQQFFPEDVPGAVDSSNVVKERSPTYANRLSAMEKLIQEQRTLLGIKDETNDVLRQTIKQLEEKIKRIENK